ncbi:hypothetical protein MLD38_008968 [Melastoma candidum]|uniref:Uncharacterized protein n=1 Tax=Melastoma candidum TaxID=119954 RepID=A0ACB9S0D6_9MYRT|nr:hypothetical protein MLD38_008968 [Melastoma candidum]
MFASYTYSDPTHYSSDRVPESSSPSDGHAADTQAAYSEDEVMLASENPKKRAGRKKFRETRHPVYRGVRRRNSGKWVCEVREPNKKSRIWLGTFPTAVMAARAHDVAALALRGRRAACLNFADSAWRLPIPASVDSRDIQKAAAEAAERFRPAEGDVREMGDEEQVLEEGSRAVVGEENRVFYMDEDDVFGMPGLLANMAEAMLLPPPNCDGPGGAEQTDEDSDSYVRLWSFSI